MRYGHVLAGLILIIFSFSLMHAMRSRPAEKVGPAGGARTATISTSTAYTQPLLKSVVKITYSDTGFAPAETTIAAGTTVFFENRAAASFRPVAPSYPERGACGLSAMDPCGAVPAGQIWPFQFDRIGSWTYYNLAKPQHVGVIHVKVAPDAGKGR